MPALLNVSPENREYRSGEVVEPGLYVDVETGATIEVHESDELPEGRRVVSYARRFQRVDQKRLRRSA